jgi:hypothetical protein
MATTFVILLHAGYGDDHYDLLLQLPSGGALATWRLPGDPADLAAGRSLPATKLPDHRAAYLTYEGPVSGRRGTVRRTDKGPCELIRADEGRWEFRLAGETCRGLFELRRADGGGDQWSLTRMD